MNTELQLPTGELIKKAYELHSSLRRVNLKPDVGSSFVAQEKVSSAILYLRETAAILERLGSSKELLSVELTLVELERRLRNYTPILGEIHDVWDKLVYHLLSAFIALPNGSKLKESIPSLISELGTRMLFTLDNCVISPESHKLSEVLVPLTELVERLHSLEPERASDFFQLMARFEAHALLGAED